MFRLFWILLFAVVWVRPIGAAEIVLGKIKTEQLEKIFDFYNYGEEKGYLQAKTYNYPPIFCKYFPVDFNEITDEKRRNALFVKILAPLTIKLNNEIMEERKEILAVNDVFKKNKELSVEQEKFLEDKAKKYDIFTRLKGYQRTKYILSELLIKVHIIPPSILITAAALETNFGSSRIVKEGNSLYKQLAWHTDEGLKPIGETEDDSYRIKTYSDIYSSMQEFALKLNSGMQYYNFREYRDTILWRRTPLLGSILAPYMVWNSPLKNYAGLFDYTLAYYELNIIDKSVLNSKMTLKPLPKELKKLQM